MNNKQIVVIRKSNIIKYHSLESISEAKLSFKIGTLGETAIMKFFPNGNYQGFESIEDAFTELQNGKADVVAIDYTIAKDKINNGGFSDLMIVESIELMNDQYAIGFRHGSDMSKKVNSVIKNMTLDGTLNAIAEKYDLLSLYTKEEQSSTLKV
ncbi:hypothetical protein U3516DRAFT_889360, partial [Neocallimastix sp. 'constans']